MLCDLLFNTPLKCFLRVSKFKESNLKVSKNIVVVLTLVYLPGVDSIGLRNWPV